MKNSVNVFPKRLTIFSIFFLLVILGFGLFAQLRASNLLTSFQNNDIPTLQLSCAATRVMSETEVLLSEAKLDSEKVSIRALVLDDSIKDLLVLTNEFPEVPRKFSQSPSYHRFEQYVQGSLKEGGHGHLFADLKSDVQTLVEDYLLKKNEVIQRQIVFGYMSSAISFLGAMLFFFLMFAIYRRYQKNIESLNVATLNLEKERLSSIQSSRLASLGEMAAGLAHEINNPLAVIIGRAEIITNAIKHGSATDLDVTNTVSKINEMAMRIAKIVTSMRKISKESHHEIINSTNLFGVVEDVLNVVSERLRNMSIEIDYSKLDRQLNVMANFTQLSQVIINLMNNAVDELDKQNVDQRKIWLETEVKNHIIFLKIMDSGSGIPPVVREKIFQPFYTTKEIGKGTGLGLSISKNLMVEMGGDLELSPDLNRTCFILKLTQG
jgi:C4-dicarboxylate-specific signal transduction histidine kinase